MRVATSILYRGFSDTSGDVGVPGILICAFALGLVGCSPPHQDYNTVPVCDAVDVNCRCKLPGWILCGGTCVNPQSDRNNCGDCGASCGDGVCANGGCADSCGALPTCGGACTDLKTDASNCGACGNVCDRGQSCEQGSCETPCGAGQRRCSGECVDPKSDSYNCGSCGHVCEGDCENGVCQCPMGTENCAGSCVDTSSDTSNCGFCGNVCDSGLYCYQSTCQ